MALSFKKKPASEDESAGESRAERKPRASKSDGNAAARKAGSKRFILIIGDEGAILVFMQGAKVVRRLFAPSAHASHSQAMVEIMASNPGVNITVLADVLDQQYVQQTFPPVSSMTVGGLVKRRLERDFQSEDLKGSIQIGRDKTGRREWKYLLIALAKTPLMAEWIDLVSELPNPMVGIYLVPVEATNYIAMLNRRITTEASRPWQLLISHNKVSGFRQVVVHDGRLVFTRVSQAIDDAIPAVIAGNIEQEIINTVEYLKRLGFSDSNELDATVIVSQDVIESLDLKRFSFGRATALSPVRVSEMLALEQAALTADRFGDVVMAAAFGVAKKRSLRFSTAYIDKLAVLYKAAIGIKAVMILGSIALIGLSVTTAITMANDMFEVSHGESKQNLVKGDLAKLKKSVEGLNEDIAFKSAVIAAVDAYLKDIAKPEEFAGPLAGAVTAQQRVLGFGWELGDAKALPGAPATAEKVPVTAELNVDFSGAGSTLETVDKAANDFITTLKSRLPLYEIKADPYSWHKDEVRGDEAVLELNAPSTVTVQNPLATIHLYGPKKKVETAAPAPVPAAPGGPTPVPPVGGTP